MFEFILLILFVDEFENLFFPSKISIVFLESGIECLWYILKLFSYFVLFVKLSLVEKPILFKSILLSSWE